MNNSLGNIAANMQQMQENQDGTLSGGFVSVTGGRYRIIVGTNPKPSSSDRESPGHKTNATPSAPGSCSAGTNSACINRYVCDHSTNERDETRATCSNTGCISKPALGKNATY